MNIIYQRVKIWQRGKARDDERHHWRDDPAVHNYRSCGGEYGGGFYRGHERLRPSGGAGPLPGGDDLPVERGDGYRGEKRSYRRTQPDVPAGEPVPIPGAFPGQPCNQGGLHEYGGQSPGAGQRRHPPGPCRHEGTGPGEPRTRHSQPGHGDLCGAEHRLSADPSHAPFDILPAVWLASTVSICVGVFMSRALRGRKQRRELGG